MVQPRRKRPQRRRKGSGVSAQPNDMPGWTPYSDGTSGHSGEASEAAEPQRRTLIQAAVTYVAESGAYGVTWREFADAYRLHHGQASSALSNAHRAGLLARLTHRRDRCGIYVTPHMVFNRTTVPYRRNKSIANEALAALFDATVVNEKLNDLCKRVVDASGDMDNATWRDWLDDYRRTVGPWP